MQGRKRFLQEKEKAGLTARHLEVSLDRADAFMEGDPPFRGAPSAPLIFRVPILAVWARVLESLLGGWMAIAHAFVSILGIYVFGKAHNIPVANVFVLLTLIYLTEIPARFFNWREAAERVRLWQFLNGIWLM